MLHRFASAATVASVVIALGALASLTLQVPVQGRWAVTTIWCLLPLVWGLWAVVAPSGWAPQRFPTWGAILGVLAGTVAGPLLDMPSRLGFPGTMTWLLLLIGPVFYYFLWLFVGITYRSLSPAARPLCEAGAPVEKKIA
jgi:hypothetical protein